MSDAPESVSSVESILSESLHSNNEDERHPNSEDENHRELSISDAINDSGKIYCQVYACEYFSNNQ